MRDDQLWNLPDALRALLAAPPLTEKKLLELSIAWSRTAPGPPIEGPQARMAAALRVFVITWDPLNRSHRVPDATATAAPQNHEGPAPPQVQTVGTPKPNGR